MLIGVDQQTGWLRHARVLMADLSYPLYVIASFPEKAAEWFDEVFSSRDELIEENRALRAELLVLRARAQRLAGLAAENERFRELLNSSALLDESILVAEIVGVSPDVTSQTVLLDKGAGDGLRVGQAVIDAYGLVGQVIEVSNLVSRVLLLTDIAHAVPVQVVRNGVRVVAEGTGQVDSLDIKHVAATMDIRDGDVLVSSGLGGRFPSGYPVGVIDSVVKDAGLPFSVVTARPSAQLDRGKHLLVVMRDPESGLEAESIPVDETPDTGPQAEIGRPEEGAEAGTTEAQ